MPDCERCLKPENLCICKWVKPIKTQMHVLILQHPQEPDKLLGTAQMAHLCLPNSTLKVGLSWRNLNSALNSKEKPEDSKNWLVLYLGSFRKTPLQKHNSKSPIIFLDRKGKIASNNSLNKPYRGLIILDGTWSQAKALWWRNAWLLKSQRIVVNSSRASLYGKMRKEPRKECLSTIESIAEALSVLENNPEVLATLLEPFSELLKQYRLLYKKNSFGV